MTIDINCSLSSFVEPTHDCQLLRRTITLLVKPGRSCNMITLKVSLKSVVFIPTASQFFSEHLLCAFSLGADRAMKKKDKVSILMEIKSSRERDSTPIKN